MNYTNILHDNRRELYNSHLLFMSNNNTNKREMFDKAKFRVYIQFLYPIISNSVSYTTTSLYNIIKDEFGDDVFVDFGYMVEKPNIEFYQKNNVPMMYGVITQNHAKDFDVILVSHATLTDGVNLPYLLKNSDIPLTIQERQEDTKCPLIFYGGVISSESPWVFGSPYMDDRKSLVDIAQFGDGEEVIPTYLRYLMSYGDIKSNKAQVMDDMIKDNLLHDYLFYPKYYDITYNGYDVKEIKCTNPKLPNRVQFYHTTSTTPSMTKKVISMDGQQNDRCQVQLSYGCSGANGVCSFCLEGHEQNNYREFSYNNVKNQMRDIKKYNASNAITYFAFNLNYYSRLHNLLYNSIEDFNTINLKNERMDILAREYDIINLTRKYGSAVMACAIEGCSDRIRNKILNKNLPYEDIIKAFSNLVEARFTKFKLGFIFTHEETKEDWEEFVELMKTMRKLCDDMGVRSRIQCNFTDLTCYNNTALRHLERKSAIRGYARWYEENYDDNLDWVFDELRPLRIRLKFNKSSFLCWYEQFLVDCGALGTKCLCDLDEPAYNLKAIENKIIPLLLRDIKDPLFFAHAKTKDYVAPNAFAQIVTDKLYNAWWDRYQEMNYEQPICLKTVANPKPKCLNCGCCSPQIKKDMFTLDLTPNVNVMEARRKPSRYTTRIIFKCEDDILNKNILGQHIVSQFLRRDDELLDNFHSFTPIINDSSYGFSSSLRYFDTGYYFVDVNFYKQIPIEKMQDLIQEINQNIENAQVLVIREVDVSIKCNDIIYKVDLNYSYNKFIDKWENFDSMIKIPNKGMGESGFSKREIDLKNKVAIKRSREGISLVVTLPSWANAHLFISSVLNVKYEKVFTFTNVKILDYISNVDVLTCQCGEPRGYSIIKDKVEKYCPSCLSKLYIRL